ncbi:MAG: asparaginase [Anaerolineales bacterium]
MPAQPIFETTRGQIVESVHNGSFAVVDSNGKMIASHGDPQTVAFLRSSAKPFQVLPFVERGGVEHFGFTQRELSLSCASHEGSDMHVQAVTELQKKIGIAESNLMCGSHLPGDVDELKRLIVNNLHPHTNHNNCSGKHTAMLAHAKMRGLPLENYLDILHPIQQDILGTLAEMCLIPLSEVQLGVDGCSAPNFALPLYNAALGMARYCDPHDLSEARAIACKKVTAAMSTFPEMMSGYGEFDDVLMKVGEGQIITKRGAEGYQIVGVLPGVLSPDAPGIGIAVKVADGDASRMNDELRFSPRVRPAAVIEILRQLGVLSSEQMHALAAFGPEKSIRNHRDIVTGKSYPVFKL